MTNAQSKSDKLYDRMLADILSLNLPPDSALRLPALSERYGIGLTPIRECLNRLASEKFVAPEHNKGFRVANLSRTDLLDLERSRNTVEGAMFADAVVRGDDQWEAAVIGAYHHLSRTPVPSFLKVSDGLELWNTRHHAFHDALVAAAQSVWMRQFRTQLGHQLSRYHLFILNGLRDLARTQQDVAERAAQIFATPMALEPHAALYDAALARDPDKARQMFEVHANLSTRAYEELTALIPSETNVAAALSTVKTEAHP